MEVQMPEMNTQKATVNPLCSEELTAGLPITGGGTIEKGAFTDAKERKPGLFEPGDLG